MADVLPKDLIIAFIIFTITIGSGVAIFASFMSSDETFGDADKFLQLNQSFNKINEINSTVGKLKTNIENVDTGQFGAFGAFDALLSASWNVLSLLPTTLSFIGSAFFGLSGMFGIPEWIIGMIILIITTLIVFAVYSAIFRKDV